MAGRRCEYGSNDVSRVALRDDDADVEARDAFNGDNQTFLSNATVTLSTTTDSSSFVDVALIARANGISSPGPTISGIPDHTQSTRRSGPSVLISEGGESGRSASSSGLRILMGRR
jgi:hypothetical protein